MEANIIVLDLEIERNPQEVPRGWANKAALGLAIGAYYDYAIDRIVWFDTHTLIDCITMLVERQPLMVSFNGIVFDFALMRAVARHKNLTKDEGLLQAFKDLARDSYDMLAEIQHAAPPGNRYKRGLNTLDAILAAHAMPGKSEPGVTIPLLWESGQYAKVLNHCQHDVLSTRNLFDQLVETRGILQRSTGPLQLLRYPDRNRHIQRHEGIILPRQE